MKKQNRLLILTAILATIIGMYIVPELIKLATYSPSNYPFVQYSSGLEELVIMDFSNEEYPVSSPKTAKKYTEKQADSLLPIFNFYQLMANGMQPDSIKGIEVNMQIIRAGSLVFRHSPRDVNSEGEPLHTLFESMPRRAGLKVPDDFFRLDNKIEFIDAKSNSVNYQKSELFQNLLEEREYSFPAKWSIGNPSARKAYDEGYFSLDSNGKLFHIKMVNNRPYIRNTKVSDSIDIAHFAIYEVPNKRFYGFVFSKDGGVYILEEGYHLLKMDIPPFDIYTQEMLVMGNILYWTVAITTSEQKSYYALNNSNLKQVDSYSIDRTLTNWDYAKRYLLPSYISLNEKNSGWYYPRIKFGGYLSFIFSTLLIFIYLCTSKKDDNKCKSIKALLILLTGIPGLLTSIILPSLAKRLNSKTN